MNDLLSKKKVDLSKYDNAWYSKNLENKYKRVIWYFFNSIFFKSSFNVSCSLKIKLLRFFGAKIGQNVVIKPCVNIKYPWNLIVGDHVWLGEKVWIDNLVMVEIGDNVCLSQGAMLLCGNHNYKTETFDLRVGTIRIEEGVWVGAQAIVGPGVTLHSHSVLSLRGVATRDLDSYYIYQGNPAVKVRERVIS